MIATMPPPTTTTNVSNCRGGHSNKREESIQDLKARLRSWGHDADDSSDSDLDFDQESQEMESKHRIMELKERLREWEVLLNSKKDALSSEDNNKVQSIFNKKKEEEEEALKECPTSPDYRNDDDDDTSTSPEDQQRFDTFLFEYDIPMKVGSDDDEKKDDDDYKNISSSQKAIRQSSCGGGGHNSFSSNSRLSVSNSRSNRSHSSTTMMEDQKQPTVFDYNTALIELGDGPMRFAPSLIEERSFEEQVESLSEENKQIYDRLQRKWRKQHHHPRGTSRRSRGSNGGDIFHLPNDWILRFLLNTSTYNNNNNNNNNNNKDEAAVVVNKEKYLNDNTLIEFHERKTWKLMRKLKKRFVDLNVYDLEDQLLTKTLFPVPGLKTLDGGHNMFYMKPSRYFPKETSTKTIINNLSYVMTSILETYEYSNLEGIGFLANMDDWKMCNFDVNYCFQYMMCLQGFCIPVKVELFLIVNPPNWFGTIWKIMKPMLAPTFRRKVKVILSDKLPRYLQDGYEMFLPDDMEEGQANTTALVDDFIKFRKYYEKQQQNANTTTSNNNNKKNKMKQQQQQHLNGGTGNLDGSFGSNGFDCSTRSCGDISISSTDIYDETSSVISTEGSSNYAISMTGEVIERKPRFTPKLAMEKSRKVLSMSSSSTNDDDDDKDDAKGDDEEDPFLHGTGWSDHNNNISNQKKKKNTTKDDVDDDEDEEDGAVFDDDISLFDETGW